MTAKQKYDLLRDYHKSHKTNDMSMNIINHSNKCFNFMCTASTFSTNRF